MDDEWIRSVREALLATDLREPPPKVRKRASDLFQSRESPHSAMLIQRVRATLVFDSRSPRLAQAGVRSATPLVEGPWQLLYRGGDVDIDLLVRPNQDGRTMSVRGQAISVGETTVDAGVVEALPLDRPRQLHGPTQPCARSHLEPTGEFALANLERGRYDVLVRFGEREIELNNVEL